MGGLKRYWRKRGYSRLGATDELRPKRRRWSWKVRMPRRVKIKLRFNPKKIIARVQEAYVSMMMRLASSPVVRGGGITEFGMRPMKEYDEKMIVQMYNSLVMRQAELKALEVQPAPMIR